MFYVHASIFIVRGPSLNSLELYWNGGRLVQSTQAALLEFLKSKIKGDIEALPVVRCESPTLLENSALALLRFNRQRETGAIAIGSSQAGFKDLFYDLLQSSMPSGSAPFDPKPILTEMLGALFKIIDIELKSNQINIDPKSVFFVTGNYLGGWADIATSNCIRFPFRTPRGVLNFEIPIFDKDFHNEKMEDLFGFSAETRILVVDDSSTSRKISRHCLSMIGYLNVDEAIDGQLAFTKLFCSKPPFELVIVDWHMPNMSGFEMLKKVRLTPELKNLPVILATGERNPVEITAAIKEGVSGYIIKPFDGTTVNTALKKAHAWMLAKKPNGKKAA